MSAIALGDVCGWLDVSQPDRDPVAWFDALPLLQYEPLDAAARDDVLLSVLRELDKSSLNISSSDRLDVWERGWGEIADAVQAQGLTYENLRPQYFRHKVMRMQGSYVTVPDGRFEFALCHLVKTLLYTRYIEDGDKVVDLGTGTASNVYLLMRLFPHSEVLGCDWALRSVGLVDVVGAHFGGRARGARLNMLDPAEFGGLGDIRDKVVLSVHSFEQLGTRFGPILAAVADGRPKWVVQIEPLLEHYDENDLVGHIAVAYHRRRGFLSGYLEALKGLEAQGRIEIAKHARVPVGNMFHEPYGVIVWRPL